MGERKGEGEGERTVPEHPKQFVSEESLELSCKWLQKELGVREHVCLDVFLNNPRGGGGR